MSAIKYVGIYDTDDYKKEKRALAAAGRDKMDYITNLLVKSGYEVLIVSPAWTALSKGKFKGRTVKVGEGISLKIAPTFGAQNALMRKLRMLYGMFWLFLYLIFNTKKDETVMAYHTLPSDYPVYWAKRIKKFKLILEVEEKYNSVKITSNFLSRIEEPVIKRADKFLFCNKSAADLINTNNKPFAVVEGSYHVINAEKKRIDEKIHLVYAGIIDNEKRGAFLAAEAAAYLDDRFILHIAGKGKKDIEDKLIEYINNQKSGCKIIFEGCFDKKSLEDFLSKMDVGLSTQSCVGGYLKYSFPSKLFTYLGLGLRTVSSDIDCVKNSNIAHLVNFYSGDDPKSLAECIKNIDFSVPYDSRQELKTLEKELVISIKNLLN